MALKEKNVESLFIEMFLDFPDQEPIGANAEALEMRQKESKILMNSIENKSTNRKLNNFIEWLMKARIYPHSDCVDMYISR